MSAETQLDVDRPRLAGSSGMRALDVCRERRGGRCRREPVADIDIEIVDAGTLKWIAACVAHSSIASGRFWEALLFGGLVLLPSVLTARSRGAGGICAAA